MLMHYPLRAAGASYRAGCASDPFAYPSAGSGRPPGTPGTEPETTMTLRTLVAALTIALAGTAFAFHCPADMAKIDAALAKNPKLTDAQMAEVKKARADGETLHKAGKHQESVDTLAKAMKILDVK
jgi:hypothetical protein